MLPLLRAGYAEYGVDALVVKGIKPIQVTALRCPPLTPIKEYR